MPKSKFKIHEITLVLIVVFIALVIGIYNKGTNKINTKPKIMEAEKITEIILDNHKISFATNGVIDENKLKEIQVMSYESFKKSLSISNDFCILLEDVNGNIILSKGPSKLSGDGIHCRE